MLNIPVTGAIQIAYTIQGGGSYNLFGIAGAAVKQEIGLNDGDLLDSVCVTYDGGNVFSAIPSNTQESQKRDFLQYQRLNDDGSVAGWWSNNAGFAFSGDTTTVCTVSDGVVQATEVEGPFEKPTNASPASPTYTCNGDTYGYRMATSDYLGSGLNMLGPGKAGPYTYSYTWPTNAQLYNESGASVTWCYEEILTGIQNGPYSLGAGASTGVGPNLYVYW